MNKVNVDFILEENCIKYSFFLYNLLPIDDYLFTDFEIKNNDFIFNEFNNKSLKITYKKFLKDLLEYTKTINLNDNNKFINKLLKNIDDNVIFELNLEDTLLNINEFVEYLKSFKTKIIINSNDSLKLYDILLKNNLLSDNIYINYQGNSNISKVKDFITMIKPLKRIIDFINNSNLSNFDKIMLTYDIVKSNEYSMEAKKQSPKISRDLHDVINGNNIVCVGFTNYFNFILNELGITSNVVNIAYEGRNAGHERSFVGINDDNYNIHSLLMCDPTWDSKKDDEYINNYKFFMKTINFFKKAYPNEIINKPKLSYIFEDIKELENYLDDDKEKIQIIMELERIYRLCNSNYNTSFYKHIHKSKDTILKEIQECKNILSKSINVKTFMQSLYKVRRLEYINGISDELPTISNISKVIIPRYKSIIQLEMILTFDGEVNEQSFMNKVFKDIKSAILELDFVYDIELDLERVKLLRILKHRVGNEVVIKKIKKNK